MNGTQRYFAEVLANELYKKAKREKLEHLLSFDYFSVPYQEIHERRKNMEKIKNKEGKLLHPELEKYKKNQNTQKTYSHLIDAQIAYISSLEKHYNEGSFKLKADSIVPEKNYQKIKLLDTNFKIGELSRVQSAKGYRLNRSFHRSNFIATHFIPVIIKKESKVEIKIGFDLNNNIDMTIKDQISFFNSLKFLKNKKINNWKQDKKLSDNENLDKFYQFLNSIYPNSLFFYLNWDKNKIEEYFLDKFSVHNQLTKESFEWDDQMNFLSKIYYQTKKIPITPGSIEDTINNIQKHFKIKVEDKQITLPVKKEWEQLSNKLKLSFPDFYEGEKKANSNKIKIKELNEEEKNRFNKFLRCYFNQQKKCSAPHEKIRKEFSLPIKVTEFHYLQKRRSWNKKAIYQVCADGDSRKDSNKFLYTVFDKKGGNLKLAIGKPFISKNIFKIKKIDKTKVMIRSYCEIDPNKWFIFCKNKIKALEVEDLPKGISEIQYKISAVQKNIYNPDIRLRLEKDYNIEEILEYSLTKPKKDNISIEDFKKTLKLNLSYQAKVDKYIFNKLLVSLFNQKTIKSKFSKEFLQNNGRN